MRATNVTFPVKILSDGDVAKIYQGSVEVLENTGVQFPSEKALAIFADHGAEVDHETQVVKIPRDQVRKAMATVPRYFTLGAREPDFDLPLQAGVTYFTNDGCGHNVVDFKTGERRASRKSDVGMMARINDYLSSMAFSWTMISAPSLHLPHLAPEGKSSLNLQVNVSYHWQNGWATGTDDPFVRTPQYRKLKNKVLDDIIREAEYVIPGLSERIVYKEMATPRSFSRWTLNPEGAIMGWTFDALRCHMAKEYARFRTPYKNLFMAGQYATWPAGVVFSAMSGKIVSRGIYGGFWRQLLY